MASPLIDRIDALTDFERRSALCFLAGYNAFVLAQALDEMDRQRDHLSAFKAMAAGAAQRTDAEWRHGLNDDHCTTCGYDLGTHHPTCGMSDPERLAYDSRDSRESLASLVMRDNADLWSLIRAAQQEAEGWHQYTDEAGDTWTTNSEY
jgi:hypothetical protein